jgi:hypothetical protein
LWVYISENTKNYCIYMLKDDSYVLGVGLSEDNFMGFSYL